MDDHRHSDARSVPDSSTYHALPLGAGSAVAGHMSPQASSAQNSQSAAEYIAASQKTEDADYGQAHAPVPPQTGAAYSVDRPSFANRLKETVGGGVLSGVVAGAVRVGTMGFLIGAAVQSVGFLVGAATIASVISSGLAIGAVAALGGAVAVGGFKLITGLFGAAKDAIFNPNKGAEISQTPQQAKEQGQGKDKSRPSLTDDAVTGPGEQPRFATDSQNFEADNPKSPRADAYGMQQEEQEAKRKWDNREPIGFKIGGQKQPEQYGGQPQNNAPEHQASGGDASPQANYWVNKTGSAPAAARDHGWADQVSQPSAGTGQHSAR